MLRLFLVCVTLSQISAQDTKWSDLGYSERAEAHLEYNVEQQFEMMDSLIYLYEKLGNWIVYKILTPVQKFQVKAAKKGWQNTFDVVNNKLGKAHDWVDEYGHDELDDCFDEKSKEFDEGWDQFLDAISEIMTDVDGNVDTSIFEVKEFDEAVSDFADNFDKNAKQTLKVLKKTARPLVTKYLDHVDETVDELDGLIEFLIGGEDGIIASVFKAFKKTYYDELLKPIWDYFKKLSTKVQGPRSVVEDKQKVFTWRAVETISKLSVNHESFSAIDKLAKGYYQLIEGISGFYFKAADELNAPLIPFKPPDWKSSD